MICFWNTCISCYVCSIDSERTGTRFTKFDFLPLSRKFMYVLVYLYWDRSCGRLTCGQSL